MRLVLAVAGALAVAACGSSSTGSGSSSSGSSGSSSSSSGSSSGGSSGGVVLGQPVQGRATYYDATGDGACGFGPSPDDLNVAAMDIADWQGSAVCGECVSVTGPKGSVVVRIVDQCPDCEQGHLDLSQQAFAQIADVSAGNVPITWQVQSCDVTGDVVYAIKDGSSQYWTALQVRNSRLPVTKLEVQQGGAWVDVARADYNYFVVDSGVGPGSYQVRITAVGGETLTDTLPPVQQSSSVTTENGSGQF